MLRADAIPWSEMSDSFESLFEASNGNGNGNGNGVVNRQWRSPSQRDRQRSRQWRQRKAREDASSTAERDLRQQFDSDSCGGRNASI